MDNNIKYTVEYCKTHHVFVHCHTKQLFEQVLKFFQPTSITPSAWKYYKEFTGLSYFYAKSQKISNGVCYGHINTDVDWYDEIVDARQFLIDNGIIINNNQNVELWMI